MVAIVDEADWHTLKEYGWCYFKARGAKTGYAVGTANGKTMLMHRFILGTKMGRLVDHSNGNGLDNRRANLRECNELENSRNCFAKKKTAAKHSRFKGVVWRPHANAWQAQIKWRKKTSHLGYYRDEEDASVAYDVAAQVLFGEFASLNRQEYRQSLPLRA